MLVASERPDLVRGLVVADASPAQDDEATVVAVGDALRSWPVPFPSRQAALAFFGGPSLRAEAWVDGLERRDDGWWPRFDCNVMVETLRRAQGPYWSEWDCIRCPTLVVRAGNGIVPVTDAHAMVDRLPHAALIELPGAKHDLHLYRPAEWQRAVSQFLDSIGVQS